MCIAQPLGDHNGMATPVFRMPPCGEDSPICKMFLTKSLTVKHTSKEALESLQTVSSVQNACKVLLKLVRRSGQICSLCM